VEEHGAGHSHADIVSGQFGAQRLRERDDGGLGDIVGAHLHEREQPGARRDIDDMAAALGLEPRDEAVATVEHAPEVDAHAPLPVIEADIADMTDRYHPGVGDQ